MSRTNLCQNPKILSCIRPPQNGRIASQEVVDGFDPEQYPGEGPYFATVRKIAEGYQETYGNGMQKIFLPRVLFEELLRQGIIRPDMCYEAGQCYHVPASGLRLFNEAMKLGTPNVYEPEKG
jgi:hypothetical protein